MSLSSHEVTEQRPWLQNSLVFLSELEDVSSFEDSMTTMEGLNLTSFFCPVLDLYF